MLGTMCAAAALAVLAIPWPVAAHAKGSNVQASLLVAGDRVSPGLTLDAGIRLRMRRGWHVYWKNPGDSGLPPTVIWTLPEGFRPGPIEWPAPTRFLDEGLVTYGYHDEVILPVRIQVPYPLRGDSVTIAARVDWLECKDICLSGSAVLERRLPVRVEQRPSLSAWQLARARSRLPQTSGWMLQGALGPRALSLTFVSPRGFRPRGAYFYSDRPLLVDYAEPQGFERSGQLWRVTMKPDPNADRNLDRLTGVLVVDGNGGSRAVQVDAQLLAGDPEPAPPQPLMPSRTPSAAAYVSILAGVLVVLALTVPRFIRRRTQHN